MQRAARTGACGEGGGRLVCSVAVAASPLGGGWGWKMSGLSLCVNPQESSHRERLRAFTSRRHRGDSCEREGESPVQLLAGSWVCTHSLI